MVEVPIGPLVDAVTRVQNVLQHTLKASVYGIPVLQMIYLASFIIRKHKPWKHVIQLPAITSDVEDQCPAGPIVQQASHVICAMITTVTSALITKTTVVRQIVISLILQTVSRIQINAAAIQTSMTIP